MSNYKLYEYRYTNEDMTISMRYIEDSNADVIYYNLNGSGWKVASRVRVLRDDEHLTFIKDMTREELKSEIFVDSV